MAADPLGGRRGCRDRPGNRGGGSRSCAWGRLVAELDRFAEPSFGDRAGVRVAHRDDPARGGGHVPGRASLLRARRQLAERARMRDRRAEGDPAEPHPADRVGHLATQALAAEALAGLEQHHRQVALERRRRTAHLSRQVRPVGLEEHRIVQTGGPPRPARRAGSRSRAARSPPTSSEQGSWNAARSHVPFSYKEFMPSWPHSAANARLRVT